MNSRSIAYCCVLLMALSINAYARTNKPSGPTAMQLIDKLSDSLDSVASFIDEYERTIKVHSHFPRNHPFYSPNRPKKPTKSYSREICKFEKGKGFCHIQYNWGYRGYHDPNIPEQTPRYNMSIGTNNLQYSHDVLRVGSPRSPGKVIWTRGPQRPIKPITCHVGLSHLSGYIDSDDRLDELLRKANRISLYPKTVKIRGADCYVIEAQTKYGSYTVWLDSEHGYHPARVKRSAKAGQYTDYQKIPVGWTATGYLETLKFKKIGDIWVPFEADAGFHRTIGHSKYFMSEHVHYKRTKFIANPDHDKLGSFSDPITENPKNDPELINGTQVREKADYQKPGYIFRDGELFDSKGNKKNPLSLPIHMPPKRPKRNR